MEALPITQQITFFYTRDLQTTARFYEEVLGLRLLIDQGLCRIYEVSRDGWVGFCQRDEAPLQPEGMIFTIVTPDVDAWYKHLLGRGVVFEKPPEVNQQYQIYHCFLRDPNGYLIEIQRFLNTK